MKKISFVIPCYNSETTVQNVVERIIDTVTADGRYQYEIICVNDYSKDGTLAVLKTLSKKYGVKVITFSRNFGQHSALMAGFHYATGNYIMCLDDDGQTPPEHMFRLIDKLREGYDLVSAKYSEDKRSFVRAVGSKISFLMSRYLIGMPKNIELNSYYVFRRYVRDEIIKYENSYPFVHGLILRVTKNMANIEIPRMEREAGQSGYTFHSLVRLLLNGFTAFSEKPLRLATVTGVLFSFVGFLAALAVVIRKLMNPGMAAGYASTMAVLLFVCGLIMVFLGMLGEYISRIYISLNNAPQYVIRETYNLEDNEEDEEDINS